MYTNLSASKVDFDKEYSPSKNSIRFQDAPDPAAQVVNNFLNITKREIQRVGEIYQLKKDISYGGENDNQLLDIYYKDQDYGTPIFVFIHGGYWQELDKSCSGVFVAPLVERGYRVINVDYNLCPTVSLQEICTQMWNFYRWLYKYADETDTPSIAICGHSVGAHLATLMLQEDALKLLHKYPIQTSFILIGGVYDLRELWKLECANPDNILGLNDETAMELSPLCWKLQPSVVNFYREHDKRIYIIVGSHESTTFIEQSRALTKKLTGLGLNAFFKVFEKYDHFDIIEEAINDDSKITKYIFDILGI